MPKSIDDIEILHGSSLDIIFDEIFAEYFFKDGGESLFPRNSPQVATNIMINQSLRLNGFRCKRTEVVTKMTVVCSTGAAATPTLIRYGVYQRGSDRNYTLIASTPNDAPATMLSVANTPYPKNFSQPFTKVRGEEYLTGVLVVTPAALPTLYGHSVVNAQNNIITFGTPDPVRLASLSGQSDLPATLTAAALNSTNCGSVKTILS